MVTDYNVMLASVAEVVEAEVQLRLGAGLDEDRVPADVAQRQLQHAVGLQLEQAEDLRRAEADAARRRLGLGLRRGRHRGAAGLQPQQPLPLTRALRYNP